MGGHTRPLAPGDSLSLAARATEQNLYQFELKQ